MSIKSNGAREFVFQAEQSIFNPKHQLLPLMAVLLADTLDLELKSEHRFAYLIEFLPEPPNFLLVLLKVSGREDLGAKEFKQLFPDGDWRECGPACGGWTPPAAGSRRRS